MENWLCAPYSTESIECKRIWTGENSVMSIGSTKFLKEFWKRFNLQTSKLRFNLQTSKSN